MFSPQQLRSDFPILARQVNQKPLLYLDNAATSQKPQVVIEAMAQYYQQSNANVHRGVHTLSDESTALFEESRQKIASFLGAESDELIFVRNSTEALNGIAYGWADYHLVAGDVILTSVQEHHSDLVVWQEVCRRTGAVLEFIQLQTNGELDLINLETLCQTHHSKIKLLALTHVSNALGSVTPIPEILQLLKVQFGNQDRPKIVLDAAQSVPHVPINFHQLDVDFLAFSGHKMLGPMGSGGLLVKQELLTKNEMHPWLFGGGMIKEVYPDHSTYAAEISDRFTAGTPDVAAAVGLAAACQYLQNLGMENVAAHDQELVKYTYQKLSEVPELTIIGPASPRVGSVAFVYQGVHAHDVAQILDSQGIAVRSGHHCTMPLHHQFHWQATTRISFQIYNTTQEIDQLLLALDKVKKVFGK